VEFPPGGKTAHALDILKKFLPAVGLEETELRPLSFRDEGPVLAIPCPYFLLFPHSRQPEKEWPHFLSLTKCLLEHTSVVWAGDREISVPFKHPRFFNLMGQTRLSELPGLVKNACGVVANDSGPMHLAAALGKRLVALFGPTSPERFGPYPAGSPLFSVLKSEDGKMDSLNPQTVRDAVLRMWRVYSKIEL
jgi:ADP-heptose:LPS heptosyltransferase